MQVVLVEEAAEVFEPHVLASLSKHTEHLVLMCALRAGFKWGFDAGLA